MQLSEEWILILDDIEDNSDERRGKPTLHKMYGTELAINAGDALHMIMWKIINDIKSNKISEEFYKMLLRTAMGQGVEQIWINEKPEATEERYFFVADSKTGYYSMAGPIRLGASNSKRKTGTVGKAYKFRSSSWADVLIWLMTFSIWNRIKKKAN